MRKLFDSEINLLNKFFENIGDKSIILNNKSFLDIYVEELSDGEMGSIEFVFDEKKDRKFGNVLLEAVVNDIDERNIMLELSLDNHGILYQLDAFTEDFKPLKGHLGENDNIVEVTFRRSLK
ncbi:DUF6984 family protein [Acinetobacter rudis]|uniref:DUF6984 domain-containing protein n=1 Tax=Acinetobacter rudis TaxID=632955 RepID=A0AAW8JB32_9GAMM|nr:hypothetical protein [Acinetobacter rudis]MDQ8936980.1 hypothetical protein [Acinetobacter rudis]MDQ8953147.1 hypothetical protein [Acinetobacter rudis]MDQ9019200.1 hypothetical protein [Acinetobacter rudis]